MSKTKHPRWKCSSYEIDAEGYPVDMVVTPVINRKVSRARVLPPVSCAIDVEVMADLNQRYRQIK